MASLVSPPARSDPLGQQGTCFCKIFHVFHLLNHFKVIWLVAPGAPAKRAAGGVTGTTAELGKVGHGAALAPARAGQAVRAHTSSSHSTDSLSPSLPKQEDFPARAKKTHLPTHSVLTMKTLIIFRSPIKGMIHLGEWAQRITQDEHRHATARPFWGSPPEKQGCVEHVGTRHGVKGWQQEGPSTAPRAGQAVGTQERVWSPP